MPTQVVATSGWTPPWFHANVLAGGVVFGRKTHAVEAVLVELSHGVVDEAFRK